MLDWRPQTGTDSTGGILLLLYFCWGGGGGGDVTRVDRIKGGGCVLCSASWAENTIMTECTHESCYRQSMYSLLSVSVNVTGYSSLCECTFMLLVRQQKPAVPSKSWSTTTTFPLSCTPLFVSYYSSEYTPTQRRYFYTFRSPGIESTSLYSVAGQNDNPIFTRFLAP